MGFGKLQELSQPGLQLAYVGQGDDGASDLVRPAELGDLETVARDKGRQRPLARSCLQADEEQRHQAQQPAADPGEEATRAHQKACPMLT